MHENEEKCNMYKHVHEVKLLHIKIEYKLQTLFTHKNVTIFHQFIIFQNVLILKSLFLRLINFFAINSIIDFGLIINKPCTSFYVHNILYLSIENIYPSIPIFFRICSFVRF